MAIAILIVFPDIESVCTNFPCCIEGKGKGGGGGGCLIREQVLGENYLELRVSERVEQICLTARAPAGTRHIDVEAVPCDLRGLYFRLSGFRRDRAAGAQFQYLGA